MLLLGTLCNIKRSKRLRIFRWPRKREVALSSFFKFRKGLYRLTFLLFYRRQIFLIFSFFLIFKNLILRKFQVIHRRLSLSSLLTLLSSLFPLLNRLFIFYFFSYLNFMAFTGRKSKRLWELFLEHLDEILFFFVADISLFSKEFLEEFYKLGWFFNIFKLISLALSPHRSEWMSFIFPSLVRNTYFSVLYDLLLPFN